MFHAFHTTFFIDIYSTCTHFPQLRNSGKWIQKESIRKKSVCLSPVLQNYVYERLKRADSLSPLFSAFLCFKYRLWLKFFYSFIRLAPGPVCLLPSRSKPSCSSCRRSLSWTGEFLVYIMQDFIPHPKHPVYYIQYTVWLM
jgi:hypothetical protein